MGAILVVTVPETIMRAACLGDGRITSAPNRDMSKRAVRAEIISMAQQARPKPRGHREFFLDQLMNSSSLVRKTLSFSSSGTASPPPSRRAGGAAVGEVWGVPSSLPSPAVML